MVALRFPDGYIAPIYTHFFSTKGNARVKNLASCANNELRQEGLQHFDVLGISRWLKLMTEKSSSRKNEKKGKMAQIRVNFSDNRLNPDFKTQTSLSLRSIDCMGEYIFH